MWMAAKKSDITLIPPPFFYREKMFNGEIVPIPFFFVACVVELLWLVGGQVLTSKCLISTLN